MNRLLLYFLFFLLIESCSNSKVFEKRNDMCGGNLRLSIPSKKINLYTPSLIEESDKLIANQLHLGLFKLNSQNATIETAICKSWDVDNTGKVYIFYLDSTVFFHDNPCFSKGKGRRVTAHDFEYTFHLLATKTEDNKNFTSTISRILGAKEYYQKGKELVPHIKGIEVLSDFVLKITLEYPSAFFMYNLAHPAASVIAKEAIKEYGKNSKIGTGPFYFIEQEDSTHILLVRNEKYFKYDNKSIRLPYLDSVTFYFLNNTEEVLSKFISKEVDAMLFMQNTEVPKIVEKLTNNIPYNLVKSLSSSDINNLYYNIIQEDVQGLFTNNSRNLDLSNVFFISKKH